jgi:hypothetical protein
VHVLQAPIDYYIICTPTPIWRERSTKCDRMERRLHPSYDRDAVRSLLLAIAWLAVTTGVVALGSWAGARWLQVAGMGIFLAGFGYGIANGRHINARACPGCARPLFRPRDATEFICDACQVVWWTRSFGTSVWDWGRRPQ